MIMRYLEQVESSVNDGFADFDIHDSIETTGVGPLHALITLVSGAAATAALIALLA